MDGAWGDYYHVVVHTYGSWLPGDPRGFRTRHHHEHIQGDYKNPPPPGLYDRRHEHAKSLLCDEPVVFHTMVVRRFVRDTFREALIHYEIEPVVMSVSRVHVHLLACFPPPPPDAPVGRYASRGIHNPLPRWVTGKAKSWMTRQLKQQGHLPNQPGAGFAEKGSVAAIRSASHFHAARDYIRDHAVKEDAAVWPE